MDRVSNILVPIDFSKASNTAIHMASEWSGILDSHLVLLHAYRLIRDQSSLDDSPRSIMQSVVNEKNSAFKQLEEQTQMANAHSYQFHLELGFLPTCVERLSKEHMVDLIIYGVKTNKDHLDQDLIKIIKGEYAPILLVHENYDSQVKPTPTFSPIINSLDKDDFVDHKEKFIRELNDKPDSTLLIHPPASKSQYKLADQITKFVKTN